MSDMVETEKAAAKVPSNDDKPAPAPAPAPAPGKETGNAAAPEPGEQNYEVFVNSLLSNQLNIKE